jgi:lysophospholipase L1-like esterase
LKKIQRKRHPTFKPPISSRFQIAARRATTTPHHGSSKDKPDARVVARNSIALKYVQPLGIPVDDLYDLVDAHSEYYNGDVHFNAAGVEVQASQVAAKIEVILLGPKRQ